MTIGDRAITTGLHSDNARNVYRAFGIVSKLPTKTEGLVEITLANNETLQRAPRYIAVFIRLPDNWDELYQAIELHSHKKSFNNPNWKQHNNTIK